MRLYVRGNDDFQTRRRAVSTVFQDGKTNMAELYRNKYRVESARLKNWDYAAPGIYFITICTYNREHLLGKIDQGKMVLSDIGEIVCNEWEKSFSLRAELSCDAYVIMPNHLHGILIIQQIHPVETHGCASSPQKLSTHHVETHGRETHGRASLQPIVTRSAKSISSFVAGFKSAATSRINTYRHTPHIPVWQTRFHDHIIRDEEELHRIRDYVATNPTQWEIDSLYTPPPSSSL